MLINNSKKTKFYSRFRESSRLRKIQILFMFTLKECADIQHAATTHSNKYPIYAWRKLPTYTVYNRSSFVRYVCKVLVYNSGEQDFFFEIKLPYLILAWVTNNCHAWKPMIAYISKKRFWSSCLLNIPLFSFGNFMRVSILLTTSTQRRTKIRCRVFGSVRQKYRILIKTDVWSSTVRKISATRFA